METSYDLRPRTRSSVGTPARATPARSTSKRATTLSSSSVDATAQPRENSKHLEERAPRVVESASPSAEESGEEPIAAFSLEEFTSKPESADEKARKKAEDPAVIFARAASQMDTTFRTEMFQDEQPRQISFLLVTVVGVLLLGAAREAGWVFVTGFTTLQLTFMTAAFVFVIYCILQVRDGLMVRPHPAFWRIIHGVSLAYICFVAALSVMTLEEARYVVRNLLPNIPEALDQNDMKDLLDCSINANTLTRQVTSKYFASHLVGWGVKVIVFRDIKITLIQSLLFELAELTFVSWIPEFQECWWDSVFIDVLGANLIGLYLGYLYMSWAKLNWFAWTDDHWGHGIKHASGLEAFKRTLRLASSRFLPFSWSDYRWQSFSTFPRFIWFTMTVLGDTLLSLNSFFFMHIFNIPAGHIFNGFRIYFILFLVTAGISELYAYLNHKGKRMGQNTYLLILFILVETSMMIKFARQVPRFQKMLPIDVIVPWIVSLSLFGSWLMFYHLYHPTTSFKRLPFLKLVLKHRVTLLKVLLIATFLPLTYLFKNWVF